MSPPLYLQVPSSCKPHPPRIDFSCRGGVHRRWAHAVQEALPTQRDLEFKFSAAEHNTTCNCLKIHFQNAARKAEGRGKAGPQFSPGGRIVLWPPLTQKAPTTPGESNGIVFPRSSSSGVSCSSWTTATVAFLQQERGRNFGTVSHGINNVRPQPAVSGEERAQLL